MVVLSENRRTGEYQVSEANRDRSRDNIVVASGSGKLIAGTVLARITASGKLVPLAPGATDGSQIAVAVLYGAVDATSADAKGVAHVRDCEVNLNELVWPAGITTVQQTAAITALAAVGIICRP